ncbi:MAG: hypothetical protein IPO06_00135 [Leptospiraceae bacterium]|nr:hypothetical protein [Leptospiraceae bacterium]
MKTNLLSINSSLIVQMSLIDKVVDNIKFLKEVTKQVKDEIGKDEICKSFGIEYSIQFFDNKIRIEPSSLPLKHKTKTFQVSEVLNFLRFHSKKVNSSDLNSLEREFPNNKNGAIGFDFSKITSIPMNKSVFDETSWIIFHKEHFFNNQEAYKSIQENVSNPKKKNGKQINYFYLPIVNYTLKKLKYNNRNLNINTYLDFSDADERKKILTELNIQQNEKEPFYREVGKQIADKNFFVFSKTQSDHNNALKKEGKAISKTKKTRYVIYERGEGKNKIYLSLDFEKGTFEVCNFKGDHLGELFFNGKFDNSPKPDHSIRVK